MIRGLALVSAAVAGFITTADAQNRRQQASQGPPAYWVSAGVGAFSANSVSDGESRSTWDFYNATSPQYRASIEKAFSNGIAVGLAGSYVRAPIRYYNFGTDPNTTGATCFSACDADVTLYSLGISFEAGGGEGFHQVYGATAGMTRYDDFKRKSDGEELAPVDGVNEISGTFSYGFGYGFSPRTSVIGVYDIGLVYHGRDGLTSDQRNTLVPRAFRIGLRHGFGYQGRRPPVRRRR